MKKVDNRLCEQIGPVRCEPWLKAELLKDLQEENEASGLRTKFGEHLRWILRKYIADKRRAK